MTKPSDREILCLKQIADMLEGYADSYDRMGRHKAGNGRVDCNSVAHDIRQNMITFVNNLAAPASKQVGTIGHVADGVPTLLGAVLADSVAAPAASEEMLLVPSRLIAEFPEPNLSNYDHDDVVNLVEWGLSVAAAVRDLPAGAVPLPDPAIVVTAAGQALDAKTNPDAQGNKYVTLHQCKYYGDARVLAAQPAAPDSAAKGGAL